MPGILGRSPFESQPSVQTRPTAVLLCVPSMSSMPRPRASFRPQSLQCGSPAWPLAPVLGVSWAWFSAQLAPQTQVCSDATSLRSVTSFLPTCHLLKEVSLTCPYSSAALGVRYVGLVTC